MILKWETFETSDPNYLLYGTFHPSVSEIQVDTLYNFWRGSCRDLFTIIQRLHNLNIWLIVEDWHGASHNDILYLANWQKRIAREKQLAVLARAKGEGKQRGRPRKALKLTTEKMRELRGQGVALATIAEMAGCGVATVWERLEEGKEKD